MRRLVGKLVSAICCSCAIAVLVAGIAWGETAETGLDLDGLRGSVVYIDFWASWCTPCRQSFPWMQQIQQRYRADGLEIVAVNVDQSRTDAERFLRAYPTQLRLVFDPKGALATQFDVQGMPTSILIDRRGTARFTHIGFLPMDRVVYESEIQTLLSEH